MTSIAVVRRLHDGGIRRFYLAGSLGMEDPAHVNRLFARLGGLFPDASFGFHIHNLSGMATVNYSCGARRRRPMAGRRDLRDRRRHRDADQARPFGNFPTEDLVTMLAEMGIETGIDPGAGGRYIA